MTKDEKIAKLEHMLIQRNKLLQEAYGAIRSFQRKEKGSIKRLKEIEV